MEFDVTALEMLPGDEPAGLLGCTNSCGITGCTITCLITD